MDIILKNWQEVVEQLAKTLQQLEKEMNNYTTYVYLTYNEETETGTIETTTKERENDIPIWIDNVMVVEQTPFEFFIQLNEIAEACGTELAELERLANSKVCFDIIQYIKTRQDLMENLYRNHAIAIDEMSADYYDCAYYEVEHWVDNYMEEKGMTTDVWAN